MEHRSKLLTLLIGLSLVLQACNLQFVESTQKDPNAANLELTAIVQQMMIDQAAQQGNAAPATFTAEPGGGAPAPAIPAEVLPPATGDVTVTVSVATNCRLGPGQNFNIVYGMPVGQVAKVVAKNSYTGYWIIEIPGQAGQTCWLWGQYATISGDTAALKDVVTPTSPPPTMTNTPMPTNTSLPTATNTTAPAGPPNAPQIVTSNVVCGDAGSGNRNYTVTISWSDNSNNETEFWINTQPTGGAYGKLPDSTTHTFNEVLPANTVLTVSVSAKNASGSSAASSDTFICP